MARTILPSDQHRYENLTELDPETLHHRRELVFLILAGLFVGTVAMLNIVGLTRFLDLGFRVPGTDFEIPLPLAVGVLPYPITFLCTDFISELYGARRANQLVMVGFVLNLWVVFVLWLGGVLPGSDSPTFFSLRGFAFDAVTASMVAYLLAQFVDVNLFHAIKRATRGRHLWLRNNVSTLVSQLVDTTAVILITHYLAGGLPLDLGPDTSELKRLGAFIAAGYAFKAVAALLDTIPFYLGCRWLRLYLRLPPSTWSEATPPAKI